MQYSEQFKSRMIRKLSGPDAVSAVALSQETGIAQSTLSRWLRKAATVKRVAKKSASAPEEVRRPEDWTAAEKLKAVMESEELAAAELGAFLRARGLHASHLEEWRTQALSAFDKTKKASKADKKRIRQLEREITRKDKALAETAALLVLQKKARALWGDEDDSTDPNSDE